MNENEMVILDCEDFTINGIIKAAMVNALSNIKNCTSRKERNDLRCFFISCAEILAGSQQLGECRASSQDNKQQ